MRTKHSSRRRFTRFAAVAGTACALGVTLSGCGVSEITGLAQSGDLDVIYISAATVNALTAKGYTIAVKPVCTVADKTDYTCSGKTGDGKEIAVTTSNATKEDTDYTISVAGQQVYTGNLLNDLDKNMLVQQ